MILDAPAPTYEAAVAALEAAETMGIADLNALLRRGATWRAP